MADKSLYILRADLKELRDKDLFNVLRMMGFNRIGVYFDELEQKTKVIYAKVENRGEKVNMEDVLKKLGLEGFYLAEWEL